MRYKTCCDLLWMDSGWSTIDSLSQPLQGTPKDRQHEQVIWVFNYGVVQRDGPSRMDWTRFGEEGVSLWHRAIIQVPRGRSSPSSDGYLFLFMECLIGTGGKRFRDCCYCFTPSNPLRCLKRPPNSQSTSELPPFSLSSPSSFLPSHPPLPSVILPPYQNASYSVSSALQCAHYGYLHRGPRISRRDRRFLRCLT